MSVATPTINRDHLQSVMTGNIVSIEFGGAKIGVIQSLNTQDDFGFQPISGVSRVTAYENAPGFARFTVTVDTILLFPGLIGGTNDLAAADGLVNFEDAGIAPDIAENVLLGTVVDIVVRTKAGRELFRYKYCSYTGGNSGIQKHVPVTRSAQFLCIDKQKPGATPSVSFAQ